MYLCICIHIYEYTLTHIYPCVCTYRYIYIHIPPRPAKKHKKACRNLGKILYSGIGGTEKDLARARVLWEEAANLGDAEAAAIIGNVCIICKHR